MRKLQRLFKDSSKALLLMAGILILGASVACDECDDCSFSEGEPYIRLRFLDSTSYYEVNAELTEVSDTLDTLQTLLSIAQDSVAAGNDSYQDDVTELSAKVNDYSDLEIALTAKRSTITSGSFFPEQIIAVGGDEYPDPPTDSIQVLELPLPMNPPYEVEYRFEINGRLDTLILSYSTAFFRDRSEYEFTAYDPDIVYTSFPGGAAISCFDADSCITENATVYVYY